MALILNWRKLKLQRKRKDREEDHDHDLAQDQGQEVDQGIFALAE